MLKIFISFVFLIISISAGSQIIKLYNTEHPDSNNFGTTVSIWDDFALIQNQDFHGGHPKRNYDLHIFKNGDQGWKEIQAISPFISFNEYKERYAVIYENTIITDIINLHNATSEYYIYIMKYKGTKFEYIDSIPVKWYLHHPILKSIYDKWFMVVTANELVPTNTTYFYHLENNKWIAKDSFNITGGHARWFVKSIMHDNLALQPALDSIIVFKRNSNIWKISQKLYLPWEYTWNSSVFYNDISLSPDEKWIAGTVTDSLYIFSNKLTYLMIYKLNGTKYELSQTIRHVSDDSLAFARAMNISDNELLIGAPLTNDGRGTIYYYTLQGDTWVLKGEIKPPPQDTFYGYFGASIDRYGETVIVGAEKDKTYNYAPGAAYIFKMPARDTVKATICEGENYHFGDKVLTDSGHYVDTLTASYGVDSVVQLYLKVLPVDEIIIDTILCDGESIQIGDSTFTEAGEYTLILKNQYNCDSIININISISELNIDTTYISADYKCNVGKIEIIPSDSDSLYSYVWNTGDTGNSINSLSSGDYSVIIRDKNSCEFKRDYYVPDSIPYLIPNAFFPSGSTDDINSTFKLYSAKNVKILSTEIFNRWGERVFNTSNNNKSWDGTFRGKPQPPGVYLYRIVINSPCKEDNNPKTGQVLLLR